MKEGGWFGVQQVRLMVKTGKRWPGMASWLLFDLPAYKRKLLHSNPLIMAAPSIPPIHSHSTLQSASCDTGDQMPPWVGFHQQLKTTDVK